MITSWQTILTPDQLEQYWQTAPEIGQGFNRKAKAWWDSRDRLALLDRLNGAWDACEMNAYVLARSYLAAQGGKPGNV